MATNEERMAFLKRLMASKHFKAKKAKELLLFLSEQTEPLRAAGIEELHYGRGRHDENFDEDHARQAVEELRKRLQRYEESFPTDSMKAECVNEKGYILRIQSRATPSEVFWAPHLRVAQKVLVICADHLFLFDAKNSKVVRYYNFNEDGTPASIAERFRLEHPEDPGDWVPSYNFYLATGEVMAFETLQKWFFKRRSILLPRVTCRNALSERINRSSPIYLGRPATHEYMRELYNNPATANFRYRPGGVTAGAVQINGIRSDEREALQRFGVSKDGKLSASPSHAFGILARLPNPSGLGGVTIITFHYYSRVVAKIVEMLTNDDEVSEILGRMNVGDEVPAAFEMLFRVALSPGAVEGEGTPELLCWHPVDA